MLTKRKTQTERLKELFESRPNQRISLPEILSMGIAQYNARIYELRHEGMCIINEGKRVDGIHQTWFIYKKFPKSIFEV